MCLFVQELYFVFDHAMKVTTVCSSDSADMSSWHGN